MTEDDICGAERSDGGTCQNAPMENGRCYHHGGASTGNPDGAPEGNDRAVKHGVYQDMDAYYQGQPEEDQAFIDSVFDSLLTDAPFDDTNVAKAEKLWQVAIDLHKRRSANEYLEDEGLVTTVSYTDDGQPIEDEHYLNVTYDRLGKETTRALKELGVLDDPDSEKADAAESLVQILSEDAE